MKSVSDGIRAEQGDNVKRGAKLLDELIPGWHKRVKLEILNMGEPSLCMLGQLFGHDTEMAIAKEMYPEEMAKTQGATGWSKGNNFVYNWALSESDITKRTERMKEYGALGSACSGHPTECLWAEEVAERVARDEQAAKD